MYQTLLTTLENNIFTIIVNRPDKLNAINATVMTELGDAVKEIYSNKDIRSAIITGSGGKAFVAGADISEFNGIREDGTLLSKKARIFFYPLSDRPSLSLAP